MAGENIANMSKNDIVKLIEDLVFDYDNPVQDIRDFKRRDLHNIDSDMQWKLHNGREIHVNITIED